MRLLCTFILLVVIAASVPAFNVQGHITGGSGLPLRWIYGFPTTLDTILVTFALPIVNTYTLTAPAGSYVLFSFQDLNTNLTPDLDEPRGFYGGQPPQLLVLSSDTTGIDIELLPPNSGGFTGVISYSGGGTGLTFISAHRDPAFSDTAHGLGALLNNTGSGAYTAFVDSFGIYYAYAFMDLNTNFLHDPDEPYGVYGGATPLPINVQPTNFPDSINIVLEDPSAAPMPPLTLPANATLDEIYPNPFNSQAVISFTLARSEQIELSIYDLLGRRVEIVADQPYDAGQHQVTVQAGEMPTGLYFINLNSMSGSVVHRLLLLK